jgi:cyanate permease
MVGAPICGYLLDKNWFDLQGWQLVFIVTGLPSVLLTVVVLLWLPASPLKAAFLSDDEKKWLGDTLETERLQAAKVEKSGSHVLRVLTEPRVIGMALYYMMLSMSVYGVSYWLPTLVKGFGVTNTVNGLLNIVPWLAATIVLAWLPSKLRKGNRTTAAMLAAALIGVVFFLGSVFLPTNTLRFVALCLGAPCMYLLLPCFWTIPPKFLTGARAAAGIAAINSLGNVGGFIAQNLVPWVRQTSGSVKAPMLIPAACLLIFAVVTMILMRREAAARADVAALESRV